MDILYTPLKNKKLLNTEKYLNPYFKIFVPSATSKQTGWYK